MFGHLLLCVLPSYIKRSKTSKHTEKTHFTSLTAYGLSLHGLLRARACKKLVSAFFLCSRAPISDCRGLAGAVCLVCYTLGCGKSYGNTKTSWICGYVYNACINMLATFCMLCGTFLWLLLTMARSVWGLTHDRAERQFSCR